MLAGETSSTFGCTLEVNSSTLLVLCDEGTGVLGWSWDTGGGGGGSAGGGGGSAGWGGSNTSSSRGWGSSGSSAGYSAKGSSGGRGSWLTTRHRSIPDSWAGDLVLGSIGVVKVEENSGVVAGIASNEVELLWWLSSSAGGNLDLGAGWVELSTTSRVGIERGVGLVVGNDLGADEVVAGGESAGELNRVLSAVGYETLNSPLSVGESLVGDLGPDGTVTVGGGLGNVDEDWALVGKIDDVVSSVVMVPLKVNSVTGLDGDGLRNDTVVGVAVNVGLLEILDWRVVWRRTNVGVSSITLESTVNPQTENGRVSRSSADESGNEWDQSCKLHFDGWIDKT